MAEKETKEKKETKEVKEVKEKKKKADEAPDKKAEETQKKEPEVKADEEAAEEVKELKTSTENNRRKKAERREAKAARKEANMVEEKKRRPNNALIAVLIFGVMIGMFAFIWGYNYFQKPESIEAYMEKNGMTEIYKSFMVDEYTTAAVKAEGNTVKIVLKIAEDAPEEAVEEYKGEDGEKNLKDIGAYFLTSFKPEVRGITGEFKALAKQGDERLCYVKMSYREAKKYVKEAEKEAEEEAEEAEEAADTSAESTEEASE